MRILVLTPTFLPALGGAELVVLQVYRRLADEHAVLVLTPYLSKNILKNNSSTDYDHLVNFGVERFKDKYSFMKLRGHRVTSGLIPPFSLSAVSAIRQAVKRFKPDVINVHYVMPTGLAGLYTQKVAKIPTVITYNGRDVPGPGVPWFWKYWHKFIGLNCEDVTFVSKYCRDSIFGNNSDPGHIIYNGVDESIDVTQDSQDELRAELKLRKEENILFALQRIDYLKRVDVIIQSMPTILKYKPHTRLVIGGKGPDIPRLKKIVDKLDLTKKIIFTGFISNSKLPVYFSLADLFVFHSTYETFGIVLAEAMNYGKVIVSANNTAIKEVVVNGKNGILVPTSDPCSFASAALALLNDEERRITMGREGKRRTRKLFQWEIIASQYEKVLESVVSKNARLS
jgi:glycosyltransferase involved in cell wall biosynthesis